MVNLRKAFLFDFCPTTSCMNPTAINMKQNHHKTINKDSERFDIWFLSPLCTVSVSVEKTFHIKSLLYFERSSEKTLEFPLNVRFWIDTQTHFFLQGTSRLHKVYLWESVAQAVKISVPGTEGSEDPLFKLHCVLVESDSLLQWFKHFYTKSLDLISLSLSVKEFALGGAYMCGLLELLVLKSQSNSREHHALQITLIC